MASWHEDDGPWDTVKYLRKFCCTTPAMLAASAVFFARHDAWPAVRTLAWDQPVSLTMLSKVPAIRGDDYLPTQAITRLDVVLDNPGPVT